MQGRRSLGAAALAHGSSPTRHLFETLPGEGHVFKHPKYRRGSHKLRNSSPGVDQGVVRDWMDGAKDLAGNDRVVKFRKGTWLVDMGAYESPWVGPGFMLLLR